MYTVISLWQPWATLVVLGEKAFETRSWAAQHRGRLLIHASKRKSQEQMDIMRSRPFLPVLTAAGYKIHRASCDLPTGAIIGEVDLTWSASAESIAAKLREESNLILEHIGHPGEQELAFGDFSPGRSAWALNDAVRYDHVIPARGFQGIFTYQTDTPILSTGLVMPGTFKEGQ